MARTRAQDEKKNTAGASQAVFFVERDPVLTR
jgi:hypothetical protein